MKNLTLKKYLLVLAAIAAVAFIIRLTAGFQMQGKVPAVTQPSTQTDMYTYMKYAEDLSNGRYEDHEGAYYYQPFYYAVYLRSIFAVFGSSSSAVIVSQALLGALTVFLAAIIAARLGGRWAGVLAAVIVTFYRNHILYTPFALIAILQTFLITLFVYLLLVALEKKELKYWIMCSLTLSCSILTRGNLILIIPFLLFFLWRAYKDNKKAMLVTVSIVLLCVYLPQLPFSINNKQVTGEWTGPSTAGDKVLAIGNNPDSPPGTDNSPFPHYIIYDEYDAFTHWQILDSSGDKSFKSSISGWILSNPLEWLELKFRTASLFMTNDQCYNNITLAQASGKGRVTWLNSVFLLDFWIVGIPFSVLLLRTLLSRSFRKRENNVVLTVTVVYIGSIVLFYVLSRYRLPVVPLMAACGAGEMIRWRHAFQASHRRRKVMLLTLIMVSAFIVARFYTVYTAALPAVMRTVEPQGSQFANEKAMYIKDHPHGVRGGWQFVEFQSSKQLVKEFVLSEDVSSSGFVRLLLYEQPGNEIRLKVSHANNVSERIHSCTKEGWNWVEIPLSEIVSSEKKLKFTVDVNSAKASAVQYTYFRNYGRSQEDGKSLDGEWILQLKILKNKEN